MCTPRGVYRRFRKVMGLSESRTPLAGASHSIADLSTLQVLGLLMFRRLLVGLGSLASVLVLADDNPCLQ